MMSGGGSARKLSVRWASVAHPVAQEMGVARDGTGAIPGFGVKNSDRGLARPLQKGVASVVGAGWVVLAGVTESNIWRSPDDERGSVSSRQTVFFPEREPNGFASFVCPAAPVFLVPWHGRLARAD